VRDDIVWHSREQTRNENMHKPVPVKRKFGLQPAVRKVMLIISSDSQGLVMEYLESGTLGNNVLCCKICEKLKPTV